MGGGGGYFGSRGQGDVPLNLLERWTRARQDVRAVGLEREGVVGLGEFIIIVSSIITKVLLVVLLLSISCYYCMLCF